MKTFLTFLDFLNITEGLDPYYRTPRVPDKWYHGSTDKNLNGKLGIHVGSKVSATEALESRIGVPAEGEWDGTREYGKTKLMGKINLHKTTKGIYKYTGFNVGAPEEDYFPTEAKSHAVYSDGKEIDLSCYPIVFEIRIIGRMSNSTSDPMEDFRANGLMRSFLKRGKAKSGYYYQNISEDVGSVSAVVPDSTFLKII